MNEKNLDDVIDNIDSIGNELYSLMKQLFPICRSITGNGVRDSLKIISEYIPLELTEVPTNTPVFDWTIPKEWNITDAYVKDSTGKKIIDFNKSNLHVLNYSTPINQKMSLSELKPHLFSSPEQPNVIPYFTSYYKENWGFCISHNQLKSLEDDVYEVVIDSSLTNGSLTYGEFLHKGELDDEVLISCYVCHPSMCNDNLSGIVVTTFLAKILQNCKTKYSYRFLFIPETIGAITWLCKNENNIQKIKHGLVVTCAGDSGNLTYKQSRKGNAEIDRSVENVLKFSGKDYTIEPFFPSGSDERQFCSPGFDLPVGSLMRTRYTKFPQYHTSADDLNFVKSEFLGDTLEKYYKTIFILENNNYLINQNPKCEPQLGKYGLYGLLGGQKIHSDEEFAMLWILNFSDGNHSLLDISEKSNLSFFTIKRIANKLLNSGLLKSR